MKVVWQATKKVNNHTSRFSFSPKQDYHLVRNPLRKQSVIFPGYKINYLKAELYFKNIIEHKTTPWTAKEYYQVCNDMHKILLAGQWYNKKSLMGKVKGGKLRGQTAPKSGRPHVREYAQAIANKHQVKIKAGALAVRRVKENLPDNPKEGGHAYPIGHKGLVAYYKSAVVSLNALMKASSSEKKLNCLGDLYHTMINARPFTQVNQSLFMNQINVLLKHMSLSTVHHGHLDHLAHRFDYREFRKLFRLHYDGKLGMARFKHGSFIGFAYWSKHQ